MNNTNNSAVETFEEIDEMEDFQSLPNSSSENQINNHSNINMKSVTEFSENLETIGINNINQIMKEKESIISETSENQNKENEVHEKTENILDTSTFLLLNFKLLNITKSIPKDMVQVNAADSYIKSNKKIIESAELDAIRAYDNETRKTIKEMTLKSFHSSIYIVPEESIMKIENFLNSRQDGRDELVDNLVIAYPNLLVKASRTKEEGGLGELYNEKDYMDVDSIKECFEMDWMFVSFNVAQSLKKIDQAMYDAAIRKGEQKATNLLNKLRTDIKVQFLDLLNDMINKLKGSYDGKQKKLQQRFINNVYEFIDEYQSKNSVLKDEELNRIVGSFKDNLKRSEEILVATNIQRKLQGKEEVTLVDLIKTETDVKSLIEDAFSTAKSLIEENMKNNEDERSIDLDNDEPI